MLGAAVLVGREGRWSEPYRVPAFRQKGAEDPRVVITEFSDFQCGGCAEAQPALRELLERHRDTVRLVFRHNPLKMHTWAVPAAKAADCAGAQGKFWEYHDLLFATQAEWGRSSDPAPLFEEYARRIGLDAERFRADLAAGRWDKLLEQDKVESLVRSVSATPTFFIGEKRLVGASQLRAYGERYVESESMP